MEKMYKKSLRMIKNNKITNVKDYYKLQDKVLNIFSLKLITGKRNFKDIVKIANEV